MTIRIRKVLGGIPLNGVTHGIGKLESGQYATGYIHVGMEVQGHSVFDSLDEAVEHWFASFPLDRLNSSSA